MKSSIIAGITLLAGTALAADNYGASPSSQSLAYHTKYAAVAGAYRDVDLTGSNRAAAFCLGEISAVKSGIVASDAKRKISILATAKSCTRRTRGDTCAVASGGTNADCENAITDSNANDIVASRAACDAASTSGGDGTAANSCVFAPHASPYVITQCTHTTAAPRNTKALCEAVDDDGTGSDGVGRLRKCVFTAIGDDAQYPAQAKCADPTNELGVSVSTPATNGVFGCAQIIPYYTSVRDGLVSSIAGALRSVDDNTGTQQDLNALRISVEEAQKNTHNVVEFCNDLAASVRINRNTFHAYTSAWANIKFGDGTLSKARMLRAAEITHQDVVVNALKSIEHEPEVVLALLA